jgi:hypothetical protein
LWFTDFRYLNDLSELKYGVNLFKESLARVEAQRNSNLTLIVSEIRNHFDEALTYTDQFVFCMCAENNLLNQWRVYGREVPVCIELGTRDFRFVKWEPNDFEIMPMVYDLAMQKRIVDTTIAVGASAHEDCIFRKSRHRQRVCRDIRDGMCRVLRRNEASAVQCRKGVALGHLSGSGASFQKRPELSVHLSIEKVLLAS